MKIQKILVGEIPAGGNATWEAPVIPEEDSWTVRYFGACDVSSSDQMGSTYILRFGEDILRIISLVGNTIDLTIDETFVGDGAKRFSIERRNESGFAKRLPCWLIGYKP